MVYLVDMVFKNNLVYDVLPGPNNHYGTSFAGGTNSGILYDPTNLVMDYNVFAAASSTAKQIIYNGTRYATAEALDAAVGLYTHNSSATPTLVDLQNYDFRPATNDTALVGQGADLSALANRLGGMTDLFTDLKGQPRGVNGVWTIGAYEPGVPLPGVAPSITQQPRSQTAGAESPATFSVTATGTAPLAYQWRFNGVPIAGATAPSYTIAAVTPNNAGNYAAAVTSPYGAVTSIVTTLTVTDSSATADSSLLVHLTFDDLSGASTNPVSRDATGNGHDMVFFGFPATRTNWPTRVAYTNGTGYAAQFQQDYLPHADYGNYSMGQFGAITNLSGLTNLTALTVCVWAKYFRPPGVGYDGNCTFIDVSYGRQGPTWSLGRNYAWQTSFDVFTNLNFNTDRSLHLNYPDNLSTDWHFYAATMNCTNGEMKNYLDGTNCYTANTGSAIPFLTVCRPQSGGTYAGDGGWIAVGCRTHSGSPSIADGDRFPNNAWMNGQLHDLRIYNRVLNASEINLLYLGMPLAMGTPPGNTRPRGASNLRLIAPPP
jgi:hypothetical protein